MMMLLWLSREEHKYELSLGFFFYFASSKHKYLLKVTLLGLWIAPGLKTQIDSQTNGTDNNQLQCVLGERDERKRKTQLIIIVCKLPFRFTSIWVKIKIVIRAGLKQLNEWIAGLSVHNIRCTSNGICLYDYQPIWGSGNCQLERFMILKKSHKKYSFVWVFMWKSTYCNIKNVEQMCKLVE